MACAIFFAGLSFDNYAFLGSDPLYVLSYLKSVEIAAFSTLLLLVIGYPIAYAITRTPRRPQAVLVLLVVLPFWTSFLIRIYAWMNILQHDGPLNQLLLSLHIVREPPAWLSTDTAVYIGIVYSYLPFMVLPLYATLEKLDESLLEAAADLGCPRWKTFWLVTLPLSAPGVVAGALLCFIPIVGEFVIPDLLGGSQTSMIGQTVWTEFFAQQRLADRVGRRRRAGVPAGYADRRIPVSGDARRGARADDAQSLRAQSRDARLGIAFLYLPIVILVIYSFNASRLVAVWGGWSTRWYAAACRRRAAP